MFGGLDYDREKRKDKLMPNNQVWTIRLVGGGEKPLQGEWKL